MNPNLPPIDEFDPQERELARIIRALPGGEPPASLDAKILRSAGNAAAASHRPGARWLAAVAPLWGIGGAAAAVLALGVSWQMIYGGPQPTGRTESAAAPAMSDAAEDGPVAVQFQQERALEADQPMAAAPASPPSVASAPAPRRAIAGRADRGPRATAAPAAAPPPPAEPQAFAEDALDEHVAARPESRAESGAAANLGAAAVSASAPVVADSADRAAMAKSSAETSATAPAAQAGGLLARERRQGPARPSTWLARIRELRDAGRTEEAMQSLHEFRRRYPSYVIPSDLAPLLRQ